IANVISCATGQSRIASSPRAPSTVSAGSRWLAVPSAAIAARRYSSAPTGPSSRNQNSTPNQRRFALANTAPTSAPPASDTCAPGGHSRAAASWRATGSPASTMASTSTSRSRGPQAQHRAGQRDLEQQHQQQRRQQRQRDAEAAAPEAVAGKALVEPAHPLAEPAVLAYRRRERGSQVPEHDGDDDGEQGREHGRSLMQRRDRARLSLSRPSPRASTRPASARSRPKATAAARLRATRRAGRRRPRRR